MNSRLQIHRLPLLMVGMLTLLIGMWGGLARLGWFGGGLRESIAYHGPLMISGFLGTLICLERAVATGRWWAYGAPLACVLGAGALLAGLPLVVGQGLFVVADIILLFLFVRMLRQQPAFFICVMALGAVMWGMGNVLWWSAASVPSAVSWWMGFLVLTIVGERLELSRFLAFNDLRTPTFIVVAGVYVAGLCVSSWLPGLGWGMIGLGQLALAEWLSVFDLARQTVRQRGLTRFTAVCLLSGYFWLAVGGVVAAYYGLVWPLLSDVGPWLVVAPTAGLAYDAILHAVLLGFVFAMIFGHAPIIFPAVLGVRMDYRPRFYFPLILLHLSVGLRIASDLMNSQSGRRWGGLANAGTIMVFLLSTVLALGGRNRGSRPLPFAGKLVSLGVLGNSGQAK